MKTYEGWTGYDLVKVLQNVRNIWNDDVIGFYDLERIAKQMSHHDDDWREYAQERCYTEAYPSSMIHTNWEDDLSRWSIQTPGEINLSGYIADAHRSLTTREHLAAWYKQIFYYAVDLMLCEEVVDYLCATKECEVALDKL